MSGIKDGMREAYWNDIKWQMFKGREGFADWIYETFIGRREAQQLPSDIP